MPAEAVRLNSEQRTIVLDAIKQHCLHRKWILDAAHIRSNHVHIVLRADVHPEKAMVQLKLRAVQGAEC